MPFRQQQQKMRIGLDELKFVFIFRMVFLKNVLEKLICEGGGFRREIKRNSSIETKKRKINDESSATPGSFR
jgi:hypothetical protein